MHDAERLRKAVGKFLAVQKLAVLATQGAEGPHASLVAFAFTEDLRQWVFATPRATRKYRNLRADSRVALLVDNRTNRAEDLHRGMAVTAFGRAAKAAPRERAMVRALYLARHPRLKEFVASPSCVLLRVAVERYQIVNRFQQVMELRMDPLRGGCRNIAPLSVVGVERQKREAPGGDSRGRAHPNDDEATSPKPHRSR